MKDVQIDHRFLHYKIPFVSGRNFPAMSRQMILAFIINETAARMVGWIMKAIGKVLKWICKREVIGVVKDFHFESLHEAIVPVVFHGEKGFNRISILVSESKMKAALAHMEKVWNRLW
jgi:putative ABC transport system permease protein